MPLSHLFLVSRNLSRFVNILNFIESWTDQNILSLQPKYRACFLLTVRRSFLTSSCLIWAFSKVKNEWVLPVCFKTCLLSLFQFPFGRRLPCDIYWHGVSFHDNDIFSGQVNKFPGTLLMFLNKCFKNMIILTVHVVYCFLTWIICLISW